MEALIRTIQLFASTARMCESLVFCKEQPYHTLRAHGATKHMFSSIRPETKACLALLFILSIIASVIFLNAIVSDQYAISRISARIGQEEQKKADALASYAALQSAPAVTQAIASSGPHQFVQIDAVRYIESGAILQANAVFR